jgi:YD repeat-containing protein
VVVTYSDSTPTERFCYDGKVYDTSSNACVTSGSSISYAAGRMTGRGAAGVSATAYTSFDPLGRVLASEQKTFTGSVYKTYSFAYSYNLDGSLKTQSYPSGRVVNFTYDGSGRPYSVQEPGRLHRRGLDRQPPARQHARRADLL